MPVAKPAMPWSRRRRWAVLGIVIALAVVTGLLAPTVVGSWVPVLHWSCQDQTTVNRASIEVPSLLVNSPYGGWAAANVASPFGFLPSGVLSMGTGPSNGSAAWAGYLSIVTVFSTRSILVAGPGINAPCDQPYRVRLTPSGDLSQGIPILGDGNRSDANETSILFPNAATPYNNITFDNSFHAPNQAEITTYGSTAKSIPVGSSYLTLSYSFRVGHQNQTVAFSSPMTESLFHYWFPADFGTWQVDNLSTPGGPGGGWAFSYSPCL